MDFDFVEIYPMPPDATVEDVHLYKIMS